MNGIILCVEDNPEVQTFNKELLEAKGFTVNLAMTLAEARKETAREMPNLIVLDIHLPDGNGLDFLRELRERSNIPVIALTNNKKEVDIVTGLASGCDDYLTKPYAFPVLCARIEALMRRAARLPDTVEKGSLKLDIPAGQAFIDGTNLMLKPKEFLLLLYLVQHEDKLIAVEQLYETVWKAPMGDDKSALNTRISALRKSLEDGGCGYTVTASRNKGYCFEKI